jgi:hypothetical protein
MSQVIPHETANSFHPAMPRRVPSVTGGSGGMIGGASGLNAPSVF